MDLCSAHVFVIKLIRAFPMPGTLLSLCGSNSITSRVCSPKARTMRRARAVPIPLIACIGKKGWTGRMDSMPGRSSACMMSRQWRLKKRGRSNRRPRLGFMLLRKSGRTGLCGLLSCDHADATCGAQSAERTQYPCGCLVALLLGAAELFFGLAARGNDGDAFALGRGEGLE